MKKLNVLLLIFAGMIGWGAYGAQQEPYSPRTTVLRDALIRLRQTPFEPKHILMFKEMRELIEQQYELMEKTELKKIAENKAMLKKIRKAKNAGRAEESKVQKEGQSEESEE